MTAGQVFNRALTLLGYVTDSHNDGLKSRAIAAINAAYVDVCRAQMCEFEPIKTLADELLVDQKIAADVLVYGVAMFIAQSEGDAENQAVFCDLYNRKRASLSTSDTVKDVIFGG